MQDIIVYIIVAGAAFYVARSWFLSSREGGGGCGGCPRGGCSTQAPKAEKPLIQIDIGGLGKR